MISSLALSGKRCNRRQAEARPTGEVPIDKLREGERGGFRQQVIRLVVPGLEEHMIEIVLFDDKAPGRTNIGGNSRRAHVVQSNPYSGTL